jgi:hypothetical protein
MTAKTITGTIQGTLTTPTPSEFTPIPIYTPPVGSMAVVRNVTLTLKTGGLGGQRTSRLWVYPHDPTTPGGDGPILAITETDIPNTTIVGTGAPGTATSTTSAQVWACALPFTASCPFSILQNMLLGDSCDYEVNLDEYVLGSGQSEITLGFGGPFQGSPTIAGSFQTIPIGGPSKHFVYIPIAAEVNLACSVLAGDRHAELFPSHDPATETPSTFLAKTGTLNTSNVGNNNTTGSYTPSSSEGTPIGMTNHIVWKPGILFLNNTQEVYAGYQSQSGDLIKYRLVFLQQPSGSPLPWNLPSGFA